MRLILLNEKQLGKVLANSVYTKEGVIFIKSGVTITERVLERLASIGVATAYIEDDNKDIVLQEVIESQLKMSILDKIKKLFISIKKSKLVNKEEVDEIIKLILENIDVSENSVYFNNCIDNNELSVLALHTLEVSIYCVKIATYRNFSAERIETILTSSLLHDIGKLFDDNSKPHNEVAYEMIKLNNSFGATVYVPVLHQFERVDGQGPCGVKGDKVYENSQILHIANDYANLIEAGLMAYEAIEKITSDALNKFDSTVFKDSINAFYCYPNGMGVILNNGKKAVVLRQNKGFPSRPTVSVAFPNGRKDINLTQELTTFIEKVDLNY